MSWSWHVWPYERLLKVWWSDVKQAFKQKTLVRPFCIYHVNSDGRHWRIQSQQVIVREKCCRDFSSDLQKLETWKENYFCKKDGTNSAKKHISASRQFLGRILFLSRGQNFCKTYFGSLFNHYSSVINSVFFVLRTLSSYFRITEIFSVFPYYGHYLIFP